MGGKAILLVVISFSVMFSVTHFSTMSKTSRAIENLSEYYSTTNVHNIATSVINMAANEIYEDPNWTGYTHNKIYVQGGYAELNVTKIGLDLIQLSSKAYFKYHSGGEERTKEALAKVLLRSSKFSKFAYYSHYEGNIWWTENDTVWGPFHTQDDLQAYKHPVFYGKVTIKDDIKYYSKKSKDAPYFYGGYELGVDLPRPTTVLSDLYSTAGTGGHIFSGASDVYLTFKDDSVSIKYSSFGPETTVLTANLAPNGVIYADNANLRIKGTVEGAYTVVSEKRVYLDDDIIYKTDPRINPNSTDILGIIAKKEILVTDNTPNHYDINIHASVYSIDEGFGAENYATRPVSGNINLLGGMIQYERQAVGQFSWYGLTSGFNKRYKYDDRLMKIAPPGYPATGKFEIVSWFE